MKNDAPKRMELLAPAGGMEQLRAALRFGADAAYGGMKRYGLRAFAGNFDAPALREAVAFAHGLGKRFYVTLNLLPTDGDLPGFLAAAQEAAQAGVDAAIVADLGAALLLRERLPALPLHISTQANVLNAPAAQHYHEACGAERIILARELSLTDIAAMRQALPDTLALEAFVHGAMCVSYSGRCLLSAALTGREANRGECAQPCRWRYALAEEKRPGQYLPVCEDERGTYLYSAYDLCMLEHLPQLRAAGVSSLKIEGRMKTASYVATVTRVYRVALDALELQGEAAYRALLPELLSELEKASHRGFHTGFYFGAPEPPAGAEGFSQTMELCGVVDETAPAGAPARVILKNRFFVGDAMEALTPSGVYPFAVERIELADTAESVPTAGVAGTVLRLAFPCAVEPGDLLRGPNRNHPPARANIPPKK